MSSGVVIAGSAKFAHLLWSCFVDVLCGTLGSLSCTVLGKVRLLPPEDGSEVAHTDSSTFHYLLSI